MSSVAEKVRAAREAKGYSQEKLASLAGVSQTTIDKIERGVTKRSRLLPRIARQLQLNIQELDPELYIGALPSTFGDIKERVDSGHISRLLSDDQIIPYYSANRITNKQSSASERQIIYHEFGKEFIDFTHRPDFLKNNGSAYAVYISDKLMAPEFGPGDKIYIDPNLPVLDDSTVILLPNNESRLRIIGKIINFDDNFWDIMQWQSLNSIKISQRDWPTAHRVVAKFYRL